MNWCQGQEPEDGSQPADDPDRRLDESINIKQGWTNVGAAEDEHLLFYKEIKRVRTGEC